MHGFSLNVNTDLSYYDKIIPCGIFDYGITSISEITNQEVNIFDFAQHTSDVLTNNFNHKGNLLMKITKKQILDIYSKCIFQGSWMKDS